MTKVWLAEKWEIAMYFTNNFGACCAYLATVTLSRWEPLGYKQF